MIEVNNITTNHVIANNKQKIIFTANDKYGNDYVILKIGKTLLISKKHPKDILDSLKQKDLKRLFIKPVEYTKVSLDGGKTETVNMTLNDLDDTKWTLNNLELAIKHFESKVSSLNNDECIIKEGKPIRI